MDNFSLIKMIQFFFVCLWIHYFDMLLGSNTNEIPILNPLGIFNFPFKILWGFKGYFKGIFNFFMELT